MTKAQLVELGRQLGLPVKQSWRKAELIDAVMAADQTTSIDPLALTKPNVAVVGFAEGHIGETPFDDPTWEVWGINRLHVLETAQGKHFDRWFNLHDLTKFHGKDIEHLEFLNGFEGPVYLRPQDIGKFDIPNQVPFPIDVMVDQFGRYFTNTISFLLAYAIHLQPKAMGVFGVDMAQDTLMNAEFSHQRPSCEFFIGVASGMGIPVTLPGGSDLLKATHLYGFEDAGVETEKRMSRLQELGQRKEQLKMEMAKHEGAVQQMRDAINQMDGAMQGEQYWLRNLSPERVESPNGKVE